ncbi:hypothetical protein H8S21_10690 [Erwinia persicina]|uniref:hypothetical protein n=1 Tax=Erwinia persicina TaxID=55211 RepID=UPI0016548541|nr:hypothetical protein [Erwinia persicina]MBC3945793.1 hypothetical protein [Erwinia persicina]
MSELTKCWLQQAITGIETIRDDMPFGLDEDEQKTLAALKMALSVLDAKPVGTVSIVQDLYSIPRRNIATVNMRPDLVLSEMRDGDNLYTTPPAASEPVSKSYTLPDGWKLVPIEPTEDMVISGFESEPDEHFSEPRVWDAFEAMSGCEQAAHKARLCYAAMLAAAPAPGEKS